MTMRLDIVTNDAGELVRRALVARHRQHDRRHGFSSRLIDGTGCEAR